MNRKIWFVFTFFALLVSGYVVVQYFIMDGFQTGLVKAKLMFGSKLSEFWYMMLFIHITTSIVALVTGPFTLSTKFRERNIDRHRIVGRIYMVGILLGGVSGLYLSFYATGGLVAKLGFGLLSVFWLTSAYQALNRVKNKKIKDHRNWMIRNYSLTFGAVTLRIWLPLFIVLFGIERFELSYAIIAWLAWVPNLIVAELFIRKRLNKGKYEGNEDLHF
ncbi:DUF2306 domain-containing protein [Bacillus wiedmannii]|uniref:DUF2306 domain-containing protein n=1 Tax=Bacillus wiedmannii TaxID=1890302 RepID=A0ABD6TTW7_9BACI|nr:DUF2306 domain-containing protein [Bacillus wiedmannii]PEA77653.1 hypothetical protein CON92_12305 [Bacillus wiedmannii]PEG09622.1 hypothetical protein CON96_14575 [Bacillus wiedmannii]PEI74684.1 hypothetical protein CN905_19035 [Bacillus wiedmannii]PEJ49989.1 hypothetical protein CN676_16175 [Bacillus wiedmannii]PEL37036.1 hypothetical protein CN607_27890 [Bacillus wiedmannii]